MSKPKPILIKVLPSGNARRVPLLNRYTCLYDDDMMMMTMMMIMMMMMVMMMMMIMMMVMMILS